MNPLRYWPLLTIACAPLSLAQHGGTGMENARHMVHHHHGGQANWMILGERFDYQSGDGEDIAEFEGQAWYGTDRDKLWIKFDGEYELDHSDLEELEVQALYSRAVTPFFDLQMGLRRDFEPDPAVNYLAVGFEGLAPYWFEVDAAAYLSDDGDLSTRLELEYELLLTQRVILQPRVEIEFSFEDVPARGIGSGFSSGAAGLRLRYEIRREFAPYVGIAWRGTLGESKNFARAANEDTSVLSIVAGVRFWY